MNTDDILKQAAMRAEMREIIGNAVSTESTIQKIINQHIGKRGAQVTNPATLIARGEKL